ncbi:hypothetical protein Q4548_04270 [Wenyingzhuangia sp. 2_MG-2023]|nr:hypothetical protein [Wenyingzhuangia sp. 2_MG-2023]
MNLTKEVFVDIITTIKNQHDYDLFKSEKLSEILNCDTTIYDNSRLINSFFKILHQKFPPGKDFCSIQHFCYELDFGRRLEPTKTIEQLWEELQN